MNIIENLIDELKREAKVTEKFLALTPIDKFTWKPHEKSMDMKALTTHIAELPGWIDLVINTEGIDFAKGYVPTPVESVEDLLRVHKENLEKSVLALQNMDLSVFDQNWTMRMGDHVIDSSSKWSNIRHSYSQTTHHRAQLGVYFRLLDIPLPASYGPSADDSMGF